MKVLVIDNGQIKQDDVVTADTACIICNMKAIGDYPLQAGDTAFVRVPFNCTITKSSLLGNTAGSIVVDIWKDTYANFPPTVADSICASAKPTLSSATKSEDSTLTGWTTSISAGDVLMFKIDSVSGLKSASLTLEVQK